MREWSGRRERRYLLFVSAVFIATVVLAAITWSRDDWQPLSLVLVLAAFVLLSERSALTARGTPDRPFQGSISSSAPYVLAMTLLGPGPALAISFLGMAADGVNRRISPRRMLTNLDWCVFSFAGGVLSQRLVAWLDVSSGDPGFVLVVVAIYAFVMALDVVASLTVGVVVLGESLPVHRSIIRVQMWVEGLTALLTAGTAYAYGTVGLGALAVLIVVQLIFQHLMADLWASEQRRDEVAELSEIRGQLIARLATAEEAERRRLASVLHDEALQNMLVAHQDLAEMPADSAGRARAAVDASIRQLRDEIFELHPAVLGEAGLAAAIEAIAASRAEQGGFAVDVTVEPEATGHHDALLFQLAREFLTNAAKHSGAAHVAVSITRAHQAIHLEVADDGLGFDNTQASPALANGHIGMASARERVEALAGRLGLRSDAGGTTVEAVIPLDGAGA